VQLEAEQHSPNHRERHHPTGHLRGLWRLADLQEEHDDGGPQAASTVATMVGVLTRKWTSSHLRLGPSSMYVAITPRSSSWWPVVK
jgi:hypothetical protein